MNRKISIKCLFVAVSTMLLMAAVFTGVYITQVGKTYAAAAKQTDYGVFLGADPDSNWDTMLSYKEVVIDASYFSKADIDRFHKNGQKVYSYLNVGSIENFRPYYKNYKDMILGQYDGWPEEGWIDVSQKKWQDYVVGTMAEKLDEKGIDGFFLDNFDVYYEYHNKGIYQGLLNVLTGLKENYGKPVIINGGDEFVTKAITKGDIGGLVAAVNQEDVFTDVNLDTKTYKAQKADDSKYYQDYLKTCKKAGIQGYLLEYRANRGQLKKIIKFCKKYEFHYYNSPSVELTAK